MNIFTRTSRVLYATLATVTSSKSNFSQSHHLNGSMAPISSTRAGELVKRWIDSTASFIFTKSTCPFCKELKQELEKSDIKYGYVDIDKKSDTKEFQTALHGITGSTTVPQYFVHGKYVGGCDTSKVLLASGELQKQIEETRPYKYDLIVIGGGSGGLSASKEAAQYGAKVVVLDFVKPTPIGTTWGLGGTCVNVGCIPKKLMHQAAIHGHNLEDAKSYGWSTEKKAVQHNWQEMVQEVQNYIGSLNFGYRVALRDKKVDYKNSYGELIDEHTVECCNKQGVKEQITGKFIIIATGERPRYPGVEGDKECCITSDDLFSLRYNPGKTLVIGASYVALECAGFLAALGNDVTVMVRSILLRGFDQEMANRVGQYMEEHGVKFVRECVPSKFTQVTPASSDKPGLVQVNGEFVNTKQAFQEEYNTVILAIGRDPCTKNIGLDKVSVRLDKAGRVICDKEEKSSVDNIYAIGDIVSEKLQLTPVAIEAGRNLARRLFTGDDVLTNYLNVATTVFTPLEYGAIGMAEEDAIAKYGEDNIEVYHTSFKPLEWTVAHREDNACYCKLICLKTENERVIGLHYLGPNAGEVTQGFALGFRLGATKEDFDRVIGIHPTTAENFTTLSVTKRSGVKAAATGC